MRDAYQAQLVGLTDGLADMCELVAQAMAKATRALLEVDLRLAERVISDDARVDEQCAAAEEKAFTLLALQAPMATDLRIVVSVIHAAPDTERMGDLAVHVAQAARRRHPQPVLPDKVAPHFMEMGRVGVALARKAGHVIRSRDLAAATQIERDDDAMDDLHRHVHRADEPPVAPRGWSRRRYHTAARYYERYADHAVALARRIVYVVTGQCPAHPPSEPAAAISDKPAPVLPRGLP